MLKFEHFYKCTPEMYPHFQTSKYATDATVSSNMRQQFGRVHRVPYQYGLCLQSEIITQTREE